MTPAAAASVMVSASSEVTTPGEITVTRRLFGLPPLRDAARLRDSALPLQPL